jgi:hypothetical protein
MNIKNSLILLFCLGFCLNLNATYPSGDGDREDRTNAVRKYEYPHICPSSHDFRVMINGEEHFVYYTTAGSFVAFESEQDVEVEIWTSKPVENANIGPNRYGIKPKLEGHKMSFSMPSGSKIMIEIDGMEQLFIYADKFEEEKPDPEDENVRYFKGGQVYEVGELVLEDDETLYIEGGAVVRGAIRATSARNVRIAGRGVLDHGYYRGISPRPRFVLMEDCQNVSIRDVIMIEPETWMITLYISDGVAIDNIKQLGSGHGSDGIDICGTNNVTINNCMLRNGDDCIVVKSFYRPKQYSEPVLNEWKGVENVLVTSCAVQSNGGGQAFEIGHELRRGPIQNIKFQDCDVLGVHGQGGVFGIHNSDDAHIKNVVYENIRVDHFYNKLVDLRIIKSRWTADTDRGSAENILFKDIDVKVSIYNPGYSISLIGGYDEDHKIRNVVFDNFRLGGKKIENADQLDLYIKQAENIIFK